MIKKIKAIIYARVSSKEQEETGYSLEAQEKLLKEYGSQKEFEVVKVFSISESASKGQTRKIFNEMFNYTSKNKINIILCEKVDRLTRNIKDAAIVSDWITEDENRQIHCVKENFILSKNTKAHENLVWDMKVAIARFYANNLSEEVKKGQIEKISQGWLPTKPPLGYKTTGDKGHKIHMIDEERAALVRKMFELYSTGNYSLRALVKKMFEEGLRTRTGSKLITGRMHQLLSDPFYYGKMRWLGRLYDGKHEPIISEELFDEVQKRLVRKLQNPQFRKHHHVFKAKVRCKDCGGVISWYVQKGHWYGQHNNYQECPQRAVKGCLRQEEAEAQILPCFDRVAPKSEGVLRELEAILKESHADEISYYDSQRKALNAQLERTQKRLEAIYEDKIDNRITLDFYEKKFKEYSGEKEGVEKKLHRLSKGNTQYYEAGYAIHELALKARRIYKSEKATDEKRRLLLSYLFTDISWNKRELTPNWTFACEFLAEWIPKLNKILEPQKNPAKSEIFQGNSAVTINKSYEESLQPLKDFRTCKNPYPKPRIVYSTNDSRLLLRR